VRRLEALAIAAIPLACVLGIAAIGTALAIFGTGRTDRTDRTGRTEQTAAAIQPPSAALQPAAQQPSGPRARSGGRLRAGARVPAPAAARAGAESFSIVVLPDTQMYAERVPCVLVDQARWIAANRDKEQIRFAVHVGDVTNQNTAREWTVALYALSLLDVARIPYALTYGNHDIPNGPQGPGLTPWWMAHYREPRDTSHFNRYFGLDHAQTVAGFGGSWPAGTVDNTWFTYQASGWSWLVLCLEFWPRPEALSWADGILDAHGANPAIVVTHDYLRADAPNATLRSGASLRSTRRSAAGERIWKDCLAKHANVRLVLCGHAVGVGRLTSVGIHGNTVHQLLADYTEVRRTGASPGMLRLLRFESGRLSVRTLSPFSGEELTGPDHRFVLELGRPGEP